MSPLALSGIAVFGLHWAFSRYWLWTLLGLVPLVTAWVLCVWEARRKTDGAERDAARAITRGMVPPDWQLVLQPSVGRIDGAVLLTGATGLVGGATLIALLARAPELRLSRVVLLVRGKRHSAQQRVEQLRLRPDMAAVREQFDALVSCLEGDVTDDGEWSSQPWPFQEPLRVVIHGACSVSFGMSLPCAAREVIAPSLRIRELTARWAPTGRLVYVSTAFVHARPPQPSEAPLPEGLADLRGWDARELFAQMGQDAPGAQRAMRELGYVNTYVFAKAVAEHLLMVGSPFDVRVVRPSTVGSAWAVPYRGWYGPKASTCSLIALLSHTRLASMWLIAHGTAPVVPVDLVASGVLEACYCSHARSITNLTIGRSDFDMQITGLDLLNVLKAGERLFCGNIFRLAQLSVSSHLSSETSWLPHRASLALMRLANELPWRAQLAPLTALSKAFPAACEKRRKACRFACELAGMPHPYFPFVASRPPWRFESSLRLPADFDSQVYAADTFMAGIVFANRQAIGPEANRLLRAKLAGPSLFLEDVLTSDTLTSLWLRRFFSWQRIHVSLELSSLSRLEGGCLYLRPPSTLLARAAGQLLAERLVRAGLVDRVAFQAAEGALPVLLDDGTHKGCLQQLWQAPSLSARRLVSSLPGLLLGSGGKVNVRLGAPEDLVSFWA